MSKMGGVGGRGETSSHRVSVIKLTKIERYTNAIFSLRFI
jgi:hypothetical protein